MPPMANVSTRPARTTFACSECGHESLKWLGRCPGCASWNTFAEVLPAPRSAATTLLTALTIPVNIHVSGDQEVGSEPGRVQLAE